MFWLLGKKKVKLLEEETKNSFQQVKNDIEGVGKWIKHLDSKDKQVFEILGEIKRELATINEEVEGVKEAISLANLSDENKQLFKKTAVLPKQTDVYSVQEPVQTAVQTGNFYDILQGLSSNERLIVLTLMNSDLKLSYEDVERMARGGAKVLAADAVAYAKREKIAIYCRKTTGSGRQTVVRMNAPEKSTAVIACTHSQKRIWCHGELPVSRRRILAGELCGATIVYGSEEPNNRFHWILGTEDLYEEQSLVDKLQGEGLEVKLVGVITVVANAMSEADIHLMEKTAKSALLWWTWNAFGATLLVERKNSEEVVRGLHEVLIMENGKGERKG